MLDLRSIVREAMARAESVEYDDIAKTVISQIDPADYGVALAATLPLFVRSCAVAQRSPGAVKPPKPAQKLPGSWKVTAIRDGWQRQLSNIYSGADGNKRLGDFTYDDLMHQASILDSQAKAKLSKAKGWKALADLLASEGVERVRDLPAEVLMPTLGAVA